MTPLQIASEYRTGRDKTKTIKVLAELNAVTQRTIAEILQEQGEPLPGHWSEKLAAPPKGKPRGPRATPKEIGEAIAEAMTPETGKRIATPACAPASNDNAALSLDEIRQAALDLILNGGPGEAERYQGFCRGIAALVDKLEDRVEKRKV